MTRVPRLSRRDLLHGGVASGGAALMAGAANVAAPSRARAKAPMQRLQMPGFFRLNVGQFELTVVSDGNLVIPAAGMATNVPEVTLKAFLRAYRQSTSEKTSQLNTVVINTGGELLLIDAGAGENFQASGGRLVNNLAAAGYKPEQVDRVIITHAHPDHIWGLTDDFEGGPRFPNATYVISEAEWDYWTAAKTVDAIGEELKGFAIGARKHLLPLADKMKRVKPDAEVAPGIRLVDTKGHTPGHVSVLIEEAGEQLLVTGDVVTSAYTAFEHPDWEPANDMDKAAAAKSRKALLKLASSDGIRLLCYHLPFPGVGYAVTSGQAYRWIPENWNWDDRG